MMRLRVMIIGLRGLMMSVLALFAAICALPVTSAHSSSLLSFESKLSEEAVYATRAYLVEEIINPERSLVEWQSEYATSESGPWTVGVKGSTHGDPSPTELIHLGDDPAGGVLHHLEPKTKYYVRFKAGVEGSKELTAVSPIFFFVTTAVTSPEIAQSFSGGGVTGTTFRIEATGPKSAVAKAQIESNGSPTTYCFQYAVVGLATAPQGGEKATCEEPGTSPWRLFASTQTISLVEDFSVSEVPNSSLVPETKYYARVVAINEKGTLIQRGSVGGPGEFTTPTERPIVIEPRLRNITGTSAHVVAEVLPHRLETKWYFEDSLSLTAGWKRVVGAEGVITQAEAEAVAEGAERSDVLVEGELTSLNASTTYYVKLVAENGAGESSNAFGERTAEEKKGVASFVTFGAPVDVSTLAVHGLHGEALRVVGGVNPGSVPTSGEQTVSVEGATGGTFTLTFDGRETGPIAFDAPAQGSVSVESALSSIGLSSASGEVEVTGAAGGPYTIYFSGRDGEVAQPALGEDSSGLTGSGSPVVRVVRDVVGGEGYDTRYYFEYVPQKQFEVSGSEGGFGRAARTPEVDLGSGDSVEYFGADLPRLVAGETYRFRTIATNNSPGNPVLVGEEQSLVVPVSPVVVPEGSCPNEGLRTGSSALLSDCRAFEQLTPADKGGAQEIFNYGGKVGSEGQSVGVDGDHFEFGNPLVKWGSEPGSGQSPYFFSRGGAGWGVVGATAQPEAGVSGYVPQVFSADLTDFGFVSAWHTSPPKPSPQVEFKVGSPGGPYVVAGVVPREEAEPGWVASSADASRLVLQVADHSLLGHATHTGQGEDLYEYSNGKLVQVNVNGVSPGKTIGVCGAVIGGGFASVESGFSEAAQGTASKHPVSEDGSKIFFEAVPGSECSAEKHVYVRIDGERTVDIGAYEFVAANPDGSRVLLEQASGAHPGLYLYDTESATIAFLVSSGIAVGGQLTVSEDLSTVYIRAGEDIYRYSVLDKELLFVTQLSIGGNGRSFFSSSPEGRFFYFVAEVVAGLPSGGVELEQSHAAVKGHTSQVFRYDNIEKMLQCISCSSSFDPEPRLSALYTEGSGKTVASSNGDYVFFDTPATLLPADVDGEIAPEGAKIVGGEHNSNNYSLSSDVYEWRRVGMDGCAYPQGCLSLITSGKGGFLNILLGATTDGNNVFFATNESLLPSDNDTAGDIYDARVDGGFAEPSHSAPCEGDACSTPFAAPSDPTPASSTFQGAGNAGTVVTTGAKGKTKPKTKTKTKTKCKSKGTKKTKKCKAKLPKPKKKRRVVRSATRARDR
jgi:hypothetical protein